MSLNTQISIKTLQTQINQEARERFLKLDEQRKEKLKWHKLAKETQKKKISKSNDGGQLIAEALEIIFEGDVSEEEAISRLEELIPQQFTMILSTLGLTDPSPIDIGKELIHFIQKSNKLGKEKKLAAVRAQIIAERRFKEADHLTTAEQLLAIQALEQANREVDRLVKQVRATHIFEAIGALGLCVARLEERGLSKEIVEQQLRSVDFFNLLKEKVLSKGANDRAIDELENAIDWSETIQIIKKYAPQLSPNDWEAVMKKLDPSKVNIGEMRKALPLLDSDYDAKSE